MNAAWLTSATRKPKAKLRLFCIPYAGASGVVYHDWQRWMPPSIDVCAFSPPGRFGRHNETPVATLDEFVSAITDVASPLMDLPFAVFGYSHGAIVALEWLIRIQNTLGIDASHLVVAASRPPHIKSRYPPITDLPDPEFVTALEYRFGAFDAAIRGDNDLLRFALRAVRADLRMLETYCWEASRQVTCPILALGGTADRTVCVDDLRGWHRQTKSSAAHDVFDGGHFFIREHGRALCARVEAAITAAPPTLSKPRDFTLEDALE